MVEHHCDCRLWAQAVALLYQLYSILHKCTLFFLSVFIITSSLIEFSQVPVFLNHFFTVLDTETYQAIKASGFMANEFAPNEYRRTVRGDRSYAGIYFYGTNTYFEFFDAANRGPDSLGFSMLAFGVDQPGKLRSLQSALADTYPLTGRKISRNYNDTQIAWFDQASPSTAKDATLLGYGAWIMEYDPTFLSVWNPGASNAKGISRSAILARYAAVLDDAPDDPCLEDVVGLTFALDPESLQDAVDLSRALGCKEQGIDNAYKFTSTDFVLRLQPVAEDGRGVREITMRVRKSPVRKKYQFGKSTLVFSDDNLARWTF